MKYIKHLPRDKLLYLLWKKARPSGELKFCRSQIPTLTKKIARRDACTSLDLTVYYGRLLFVDLSSDFVNTELYNLYNGRNLADKIIDKLAYKEMLKTILVYYKF